MDNSGINIVIVADGPYRGMKIYGPRLLIKYKNISILDRLLETFAHTFKDYDVFVISSFKLKKKGIKIIPRKLLVEDCAKLYSQAKFNNTLMIFEDTIPNQFTLKSIADTANTSALVFDSHSDINKHDIGGIVDANGRVHHLSYGLDIKNQQIQKWSNILYLEGWANESLWKITMDQKKQFMMNFEIINSIIDNGHSMTAISGKKVKSLNITCPSDIAKVRFII